MAMEEKREPEKEEKETQQEQNREQNSKKELEELKSYVETLEGKVKKLEELAKRSNERYLSLQRELEIIRERHKREIEEKDRYGIEKFARDLLEVMDNFERALQHMKELKGCSEAYKGIEMIYNQMKRVFEKHGITEIVVEKFDHSLCEAVSTLPTKDVEENTVVEVVQKGYKLHDRVLRPAKVVVAVNPEEIT